LGASANAFRSQLPRHLIRPYNWFTDGFDTADLKDARALLDELTN
jgi:hypothetical protein